MPRPDHWTILAAVSFPAACVISYWEDHVASTQIIPILPSTVFLTLATILMILVVKLREALLREAFRTYPRLRSEVGWTNFDPKSVSALSTWLGLCGISFSVFAAHGGLQAPIAVHDAFVVIGAVGVTFYLSTQVGLSYGLPQVTSRRVSRLRDFMRWCCLFVLAVWLIVSIVLLNELQLGRQSLQAESLRVLRAACLAAEAATLLLLAAFVATFVHEFKQISAELFKVSFINPATHQVKVEKQTLVTKTSSSATTRPKSTLSAQLL